MEKRKYVYLTYLTFDFKVNVTWKVTNRTLHSMNYPHAKFQMYNYNRLQSNYNPINPITSNVTDKHMYKHQKHSSKDETNIPHIFFKKWV